MLSNQDYAAIALAAAYLTGAKDPAAKPHATALAELLANAAAAKAKITGRPRGQGAGSGRGPAKWFVVSLGSLWTVKVQGAKAAHELIATTLKEHDPRSRAPTLGSVQVQLSRHGQWWRLVDTDQGQHVLGVANTVAPDDTESA